jgi:hypothetical protein
MKPFTYERVRSPKEAVASAVRTPGAKFIAGGTNLLDLMKLQIETPTHLIDVNGIALDKIEATNDPFGPSSQTILNASRPLIVFLAITATPPSGANAAGAGVPSMVTTFSTPEEKPILILWASRTYPSKHASFRAAQPGHRYNSHRPQCIFFV